MNKNYNRSDILEAADIACTDRGRDYGNPEISFQAVADIWKAILGYPVTNVQVALCMAALKMVRVAYNPTHTDSWVDLAGYAALGGEIANYQEGR